MSASVRQSPLRVAILLGIVYFVIGIAFAALANSSPFPHGRAAWRLAAWIASGALYAAHIGYQHDRLCISPLSTALHAALAVALGSLGLAAAACIHSRHPRMLLAVVVWPIVTGVPAFLVALAASNVLARVRGNRRNAE